MKRKIIILLSLYAIGDFVLLPPVIYIIRGVLDRKIKISEIEPDLLFKLFTNLETYTSYFEFNPINAAGWALFAYGVIMLFLNNLGKKENKSYVQTEGYASHGTSRWQNDKEIKEHYYNEPREGWFLGSLEENHFSLSKDFAIHSIKNPVKLNAQVNVVGPPGSNKTTGFVNPNLFYIPYAYKNSEEKPDLIVTDPKGEILTYTGQYFKDNNYDIKILDFLHLKYGDCANPLSYIEEKKDLIKVANGFIGAAGMKNAKTQNADPMWEQGETLLLTALIAYVLEVYPKEMQTFDTVRKVLGSPYIRDFEKSQILFSENGITGYGEECWNLFLNLEDKVRSGVVAGLSIKMTLFALPEIKKITSKNSFDFREIGRKKDKPMAIFIQMPDEDRTYSPIINTIISMMIKAMYSTARETHSELPNPVYMILEEIANIGRLPGILELLGTMRGRRIYPMMIWQDLVQMRDMFGDTWEGIVAKCDTQVFLGANDKFTSKYVSEKLGQTTIRTQGITTDNGGIMSRDKDSQSKNYQSRQLLFADEVERFDNRYLIMSQRSRFPAVLYKTQYMHWDKSKMICEPLELSELPLISSWYEGNDETINNKSSQEDKESEKLNSLMNEEDSINNEESIFNNHDVNITNNEYDNVVVEEIYSVNDDDISIYESDGEQMIEEDPFKDYRIAETIDFNENHVEEPEENFTLPVSELDKKY